MLKLHVHIGHHFFGSGNLGDDLMLAGFLAAARPAWLAGVRLTCCTPHDRACQQLRFPEIEWLPYDDATRAACVRRCDAWLGLGDTPFQATGGQTWFLDHLCAEAAWCRQFGVPMYYLGVGVNEREVVAYPQMRLLVGQAERLWLRDPDALDVLGGLIAPGQATAHADLAHLALETIPFPAPEPQTLGLVLNFEDPAQYRVERLGALVVDAAAHTWRVRWLAQEVRPLPGSETALHAALPPAARGAAPLGTPDYAAAPDARALLAGWEGLDALFVSRYHASLIGAWMGARVAVFARSDKVAGAVRQLGLTGVDGLQDPAAILRAVDQARPVERRRLLDLAARSRQACEEFFAVVRPRQLASSLLRIPPMSPHPPNRILLLRPDAYGDLFLFEPVPRLVHDAWPHAEVAVLIRQPYADVVPMLASPGVQWLTTTCNPYREGPADRPDALAALRETVLAFAPDCVVAACAEQTWLESAVASFLPAARQVSLGPGLTDPFARAALEAVLPVDWQAIYPEKVPVVSEMPEWERNLHLAGALLGHTAPPWWPLASVPPEARETAARIIGEAGLEAGNFVVCAAAGTANVEIKSWPAEHYGATLAWLEREHSVRALLIGHASERAHLEIVRAAAHEAGGNPALWTGQAGEMPIVGALLAAAQFYFGNDTGALHLAAALGRPVVPIFGGGHWPRFQPVARRSLTIVQPLPCFGCAWDCYFVDAPCVRTISAASVQRALAQFLDTAADGRAVFEADGLEPGARALIDAATPRLRSAREDSAARLRQARDLTALLHASEADRDSRLLQVDALTAELTASETDRDARLHELRTSEADRDARLLQVDELTAELRTSEADRDARLLQVDELTAELCTSEADRAAREVQVRELTALLATSETDRDARQLQVEELTKLLATSETDRDARQLQVEELTKLLRTSETDRDARQLQVEELTKLLRTSETDRDARQLQVEELTKLLRTSETDRDARQLQVGKLTTLLKTSDADRDARQGQVEELTALLKTSETDRDARQLQVGELTTLLKTSDADRDARQGQIEELTALLKTSETDRAARGQQIEQLTAWLLASHADCEAQARQIEALDLRLRDNEADRIALDRQVDQLSARLERADAVPAVRAPSDEPPAADRAPLTVGPTGPGLPDDSERLPDPPKLLTPPPASDKPGSVGPARDARRVRGLKFP